ncbi:MAG: flagellar biosynthesis protein FlhF [Planctomycetaceae bacterium]|nr:flagellar biosynthesis protein FlhF [Planctomycetaceae bacterium]
MAEMKVKTYRAPSIHDALQMVRADFGPDAAVLQTREIKRGWLPWFGRQIQIEVSAASGLNVPSRLVEGISPSPSPTYRSLMPSVDGQDFGASFRESLKGQTPSLQTVVEQLSRESTPSPRRELPESLFRLFTDLIEAEVSEELARELVEHVRADVADGDLGDLLLLKARIARLVEQEIQVTGPIQVTTGQRRLVALVGPTGVGKTTTIAKLAANFHLRERLRVGLITVDTYRIAAVEQLRTYADIIDLPMEVVATPKEMRAAVQRLRDLDLILMDTAGRSPHDEVKIQELKSILAEARADAIHLVLSSVSSESVMRKTADQFSAVGITSLILTKLDEATGMGALVPLLRSCKLPLSYVTHGQNVPDDIEAADTCKLARLVLGVETHA